MMTRKMRVTMEVDVSDLPMAELRENAKLGGCKVSDLPRVADVNPGEVANCLADSFEHNEELFAGSDMHIQVKSAKVVAVDWIAA
jgi:hypothetical protein